MQDAFLRNIDKVWGVSFDGGSRNENFSFTLRINKQSEQYLIDRIQKEGRGGTLERVGDNTFKFTKEVFDANEAMPWVKTFMGRILSFEANDWLERKLYSDIRRMAQMYRISAKDETSATSADDEHLRNSTSLTEGGAE